MTDLLPKVKQNLIIEHTADDALLQSFINRCRFLCGKLSAYRRGILFRNTRCRPTTEQVLSCLASHFYESRDGSTAASFRIMSSRTAGLDTVNLCFGSTEIGRCDYEFRKDERLCQHSQYSACKRQRGLYDRTGSDPRFLSLLQRRTARFGAVGKPRRILRSDRPFPFPHDSWDYRYDRTLSRLLR